MSINILYGKIVGAAQKKKKKFVVAILSKYWWFQTTTKKQGFFKFIKFYNKPIREIFLFHYKVTKPALWL